MQNKLCFSDLLSRPIWLGAMSGTSTDGIDVVALHVDFGEVGQLHTMKAMGGHSMPFEPSLRKRLISFQDVSYCSQSDNLLEAELLSNALSQAYADCAQALLAKHCLDVNQIAAIGAHGQTLRHRPELGVTLQLFNPSVLAEKTHITVVSDFRRRDVAAGGQGAPLVPAFHEQWLRSKGLSEAIVLNVGGFSNLTLIRPDSVIGSDCGLGNALLDAWTHRHLGLPYDAQGAWAASGQAQPILLKQLFQHPFFSRPLPSSTGKDEFHLQWLLSCLDVCACSGHTFLPVDVQATLLEFTVQSIARGVLALEQSLAAIGTVIVCGGGAYNTALVHRLEDVLPKRDMAISSQYQLLPEWVEASAFAWMARQTILGLASNVPQVTGAIGSRVLGSITPA